MSGNAMTDIIVWGKRSGEAAAALCKETKPLPKPDIRSSSAFEYAESLLCQGSSQSTSDIKSRLQHKSEECMGPVRSKRGLQEAISEADKILSELPAHRCEYKERVFNREWADAISLRNMAKIVRITSSAATMREESRGAHYRKEYTGTDVRWLKNIVVKKDGNDECLYTKPLDVTSLKPEGL